jgi:molybdate transport system substrate-binding protein
MKTSFPRYILLLLLIIPSFAHAEEKIRAAVAANYIQTMKELAVAFEASTGIKVEATFTSSGNLYGQIINGAPYDIFLSADEDRPSRLYQEGLAEKPFIYATGKVVLWSAKKDFCKTGDWREALRRESVKKIALANPDIAPYGTAAMKAMKDTQSWEALQGKLVIAQDIAQAFQYASSEAVDAGFCAVSSTVTDDGRKGCFFMVAQAPPVVQAACVLKGKNRPAASSFALFLISSEAELIKKKYGYR